MKRALPIAARALRRRPAFPALMAAALLAWSACNLSDPGSTNRFIQLQLPDSLSIGDSVEVLLKPPGDSAVVVDTLWNGPLRADTSLAKLPAPHYRGGDADLFVAAWHQSRLFYRTRVEYRKGKPKVLDILPPDSLPPLLKWQGADSVDLDELPRDSLLAGLFPEMGCVDDRDRDVASPSVNVLTDSSRVGLCWLEYHCRDRAGNASRPRYRRVRILSLVDTVPPTIVLQEPDTLVRRMGDPISLGMAYCVDTKDPAPRLRSTGLENHGILGLDSLLYECTDASGNVARRMWYVRLVREPDTVKPVLTLRGRDSVALYEGDAYADEGADCNDDRDGKLVVATQNPVDTHKRNDYVVSYACADSAGNAASAKRQVRVARKPDPDKPVIVLRGPDTVLVYDHQPYRDSGAVCMDARDGLLTVQTAGAVDTDQRGLQTLTFTCADTAGNAASVKRMVRVARLPDAVNPVLTLRGPDSLQVWQSAVYVDSGAVCLDDRDGSLPIRTSGSVNTAVRGSYSLTLQCSDSAGNEASRIRKVLVIRVPDAVNPVLTLKGPDSLQVWQGSVYADSGAVCLDDRDGSLPIRTSGSVNTAVRGSYSLTLQCSDSSGNAASRIRKVLVIRVPDAVNPVLTLRGPDSLQVWQGAVYADSGADCLDDRDGRLPVQATGAVNTALRGLQTLAFHCADSAGNQASMIRKVLVIRVPDTVKPKITLRGNPSVSVLLGRAYADAGADCLDDRDGALPVATRGSVNTGVEGIYVLTYACSDSAGNAADAVTRSVTVAVGDTTPPVISLAGTDTLLVVSQAGFVDPGGACRDSADGVLPLTLQGITKPVTGPGWYQVGYACTDKSGNTAVKTRTLKLGLFGTYLSDIADSQLDTLNGWANTGGTEGSGFVTEPGGRYFGLVRFDLSKVNKTGLKSAKLHYFTFIYGKPNTAGFRKYSFEVFRVKSDWVEGTGDWFYHDGAYRNGGETWYQYYPLSDSMKAHVTNPSVASGITGASVAMVRDSALVKVSSQSDSIYFGPWCGNPDQNPAPDHLTPVELDVTDYVKSADPAKDFGFIIKVYGVPAGMLFAYLNRETAGGPWAPRLMLEY